jgi:hypothetical protein
MALTVSFISGPRRSGKSTIIREMIREFFPVAPHYLRLTAVDGDKRKPTCLSAPPDDCGVASARWLQYQRERIFEVLPEALAQIHRHDRRGCVVIEADADPSLRHAYPYHGRVFVMSAPTSIREVFRSIGQAAEALKEVMEDTTAFASEVFGLLASDPAPDDDPKEPRPALSPAQMRGFLTSPLGDELATRIQLQPAYHGLLDSDVILINAAIGGCTSAVDAVRHRIERILDRLPRRRPGRAGGTTEVFCCDPLDPKDPLREPLFRLLQETCAARES